MKHGTRLGETYTTQESAEHAVKGMKLMMPYRNWCAGLLPEGWVVCDSIRKLKREMKKAGVTRADTLCFGKD